MRFLLFSGFLFFIFFAYPLLRSFIFLRLSSSLFSLNFWFQHRTKGTGLVWFWPIPNLLLRSKFKVMVADGNGHWERRTMVTVWWRKIVMWEVEWERRRCGRRRRWRIWCLQWMCWCCLFQFPFELFCYELFFLYLCVVDSGFMLGLSLPHRFVFVGRIAKEFLCEFGLSLWLREEIIVLWVWEKDFVLGLNLWEDEYRFNEWKNDEFWIVEDEYFDYSS